MAQTVFCRSCDCLGHYTIEKQTLRPVQGSFICEHAMQVFETDHRLSHPKHQDKTISWDDAFSTISTELKKAQKKNANSIGLYVDDSTFRRGFDSIQSLFFSIQMGSTSFYTDQCRYDSPRLLVTEWMTGHAAPLLSDLSRAHYILLLGSDHQEGSWGKLQPTMRYESDITHSRKTKGTKLIIAASQKSKYAETADQFIQILPGTESFLLLGMLQIALKSEWFDHQFVRKYTSDFPELQAYLQDYPIERCAKICGIEASVLSGLALRFTRSPMAIAHPNSGTFSNGNATLGAWAWLALQTISANALRPGGIYEHTGSIDLMPVLASARTDQAPKNAAGKQPLLLLQNMGSQLLSDIENGLITHLIVAADDILYPQRKSRLFKALEKLELLVVISEEKASPLAKYAHFLLPRTSPWEEDDILLHRNTTLPFTALPKTQAIKDPFSEAKPLWQILRKLSKKASKGLSLPKKSDWGISLRLFGKVMAASTPDKWSHKLWSLLNEEDLAEETSWNYQMETNRAEWRVQDDKIRLVPKQLSELFAQIDIPKTTEQFPFLLPSSTFLRAPQTSEDTKIIVHPKTGLQQGASVRISSSFGQIQANIDLSDAVHPQAVICSFWQYPEILELLPTQTDQFSGTPILDGVACGLELL